MAQRCTLCFYKSQIINLPIKGQNMYHHPIYVEYEDIDNYGIIHHPKFFYYMERARCGFFTSNGIEIRQGKINLGLVLRNIQINIKSQVMMFDNLDIELETSNIDKYRFNFIYTFKRDNKIIANGLTEMVFIDLTTKRLVPIPEQHLQLLKSIERENS